MPQLSTFLKPLRYTALHRLFWVTWTIMLISSVIFVPFMKPLSQNWNVTEWLIDYSNGFVRRGLLGAGINWMRHWNIQSIPLIFGIATIAYVSTTLIWIKSVKINQSKLSQNELLLLIFNPCLILFFVIDGSPLRKDILPILFSLISLLMISSIDHQETRFSLKVAIISIWEAISGIILSLSHEGIALFLWLPTHWILYTMVMSRINFSRFDKSGKNVMFNLARLIVFLPTLIACIAAIKFSGKAETALLICKNWESLLAIDCISNSTNIGAISALSWDMSQAWNMSGFTLLDTGSVLLWCVPFFFWTGIHLRIGDKILGSHTLPVKLAAWIALTSIPIYLIGWDWGRWFAIQSMFGLSIILILANSHWLETLEDQLDFLSDNSSLIKKPFLLSQKLIQIVFIKFKEHFKFSSGMIAFSGLVGLPHCCATTLGILVKGVIGGLIMSIIHIFVHS